MLNKLSLFDFQSHAETIMEFSSGVNIITGTSNSGKTSIVRMLNLIVNNKPLGDSFIKDDKECAEGVLEIKRHDIDFKLIRKKDRKTINFYQIDPPLDLKEDKQIFTAFGSNVPIEIISLLNLSDINIQQQLSPYFLVLDPPGQVALCVRKAVKLDEIDEVVSVLSSGVRDCLKEKSGLDEDLSHTIKKLEELSVIDLDLLERLINKVKTLRQEKEVTETEKGGIESIVTVLKQLDHDTISLPANVGEMSETVEQNLSDYEGKMCDLEHLKDIVDKLKELEMKSINLPKDIDDKISSIEKLFVHYGNDIRAFIHLTEIVEDFEGYETTLLVYKGIGDQLDTQRQTLLHQLKNCPSCGIKLTEEARVVLLGE